MTFIRKWAASCGSCPRSRRRAMAPMFLAAFSVTCSVVSSGLKDSGSVKTRRSRASWSGSWRRSVLDGVDVRAVPGEVGVDLRAGDV